VKDFVDYFDVRQKHSSATVTFDSQAIEYVAGAFARLYPSRKFFPSVSNESAAGEASYWDYHFLSYL